METIQTYFQDNQILGGVLLLFIGIMLLLGSIYDWNWIFGNINPNNYNTQKTDGLLNMFGRKTARVIFGIISVVVMIGGIGWIIIYTFVL